MKDLDAHLMMEAYIREQEPAQSGYPSQHKLGQGNQRPPAPASGGAADAAAAAASDPSAYSDPVVDVMNILTSWMASARQGKAANFQIDQFNTETGEKINPEVIEGMKPILDQIVNLGVSSRGGARTAARAPGSGIQPNVPR